jgi:hypothetical protein
LHVELLASGLGERVQFRLAAGFRSRTSQSGALRSD